MIGWIIGTLVLISALGAGAVVAVTLVRPGQDNAALIAAILSFLGPTTTALVGLLKAVHTGQAVEKLHLAVNSRLTTLLEQTAMASRATGREEGRQEGFSDERRVL